MKVKLNEVEVEAKARVFKSGKTGFGFYDKIHHEGKRYQVSLNIVEIQ